MRQKKRSTGFIWKTLSILALLTAVSGLSALSFAPYPNELHHTQHGARLAIDTPDTSATDTPGAAATDTPDTSATDTPGASTTDTPGVIPPGAGTPGATDTPSTTETPSETGTPGGATTPGQQTFIGQIPNANNPSNMTWVALSSSNGKQMTAFVTDGTKDHAPTFAHWYDGDLQNNKFTAPAGQPNAGKIEATLTQNTATGTVTLPDGKTLPFTADVLQSTNASSGAGLYKSEQVVNGVDYVVGWIVAPNPTANPSATGTVPSMGSPSATGTVPSMGSPSATGTVPSMGSPSATGTAPGMGSPSATGTAGLFPAETASPSTTLSPTGSPGTGISGMVQAGAVYNKQTKAVSPVPELTSDDLQTRQVTLPKLGSFNLMECQNNLC